MGSRGEQRAGSGEQGRRKAQGTERRAQGKAKNIRFLYMHLRKSLPKFSEDVRNPDHDPGILNEGVLADRKWSELAAFFVARHSKSHV